MGNINAPSITYFESFVAEIKGKFQRVRNQEISDTINSVNSDNQKKWDNLY